MKQIIIRKETPNDYKKTEYMTLRAFWNQHGPGCNEHYLVHLLRDADCYLPELSRVAEFGGRIVGTIMFFKAKVVDGDTEHEVLSFGPLCVEPTFRNSGVGKMLMEESFAAARAAGYPGIIIFGEPGYYPRHGFRTCDCFGITTADGANFDAFMAYPLDEAKFSGIHGRFYDPEVFEACNDEAAVSAFTAQFPYHKPLKFACQWLHEEQLGRISEIRKNAFYVRCFEEDYKARLKGSLYDGIKEMPVVGDYVTFKRNPRGDSVITSVCERSSVLKRPDQSGHAIGFVKTMLEQVMVANFDYVFIVTSLNGNYNYNRIARYVSITLQGGGIPVVILSKADLCPDPAPYIAEVSALSDKVRVHTVSARFGTGLEELKRYLSPGTTIAILGSSGVGKSTLVNALAGEEVMKTSAIRETDSKGRHTTTHREIIELPNGVSLIDTPGMRELGMCDVEEGIDTTFEDIVALEHSCAFSDCRHRSEPGCAIKQALRDGTLSEARYSLYLSLSAESDKAAHMKAVAQSRRAINRAGRSGGSRRSYNGYSGDED